MWSKLAILLTVLLALLAAPAPVQAQAAPPPLPDSLVIASQQPSSDQEKQIAAYVEHWTIKLTDADPAVTVEARNKLIDPVRAGRSAAPSPTFRYAYSKALVPKLGPVIGGPNAHAAINGLQVAGSLGTDSALNLAMNHVESGAEPRTEVRIWAAKAFMLSVANGLRSNALANALRPLRRAGESEKQWTALNSQLASLAEVDRLSRKDSTLPQNIFETRVAIIGAALDRMAATDAAADLDLMKAVHPAIYRMFKDFLEMSSAQKQEMGKKLAPRLATMFKVAQAHWEQAQKDPKASKLYGNAIASTENFLKQIDGVLRANPSPPVPGNSKVAWDAKDRTSFEAAGSGWTSIVSKPPYEKP